MFFIVVLFLLLEGYQIELIFNLKHLFINLRNIFYFICHNNMSLEEYTFTISIAEINEKKIV